jgi:hypothetical protein
MSSKIVASKSLIHKDSQKKLESLFMAGYNIGRIWLHVFLSPTKRLLDYGISQSLIFSMESRYLLPLHTTPLGVE